MRNTNEGYHLNVKENTCGSIENREVDELKEALVEDNIINYYMHEEINDLKRIVEI